MSNLLETLGNIITHYPAWSYAALSVSTVIQAELTVLVAVYLAYTAQIPWIGPTITIFLAQVFVELIMYGAGRILKSKKIGLSIRNKIPYYAITESLLASHPVKMMILGKFVIGLNMVFLFIGGGAAHRISFKKFFKAHLISVIIWLPAMIAIAYMLVSGLDYLRAAKILKRVELGVGVAIILIFIFEYTIKKLFTKGIALTAEAQKIGKYIENKTEQKP